MTVEILRALLYISGGVDIGSTWKGLAFGQKEANPILGQSRTRQAVFVFGSIVIVDMVSRWALAQGSPAAAILVLASCALFHFIAFALNLRSFK